MDTLISIAALILSGIVAATTYNTSPLFGHKRHKAEKIKLFEIFHSISKQDTISDNDKNLLCSLFQLATGHTARFDNLALILTLPSRLYLIDNYSTLKKLFIADSKRGVILHINNIHILFSRLPFYLLIYCVSSFLLTFSFLGAVNLSFYYERLPEHITKLASYHGRDIFLISALAIITIHTLHQLRNTVKTIAIINLIKAKPGENYRGEMFPNRKNILQILYLGLRMLPKNLFNKDTYTNGVLITMIGIMVLGVYLKTLS